MDRRHFLALASAPALAALLDACSNSATKPTGVTTPGQRGGTVPGKAGLAKSDIARTETSPNDVYEAAYSVEAAGMGLYRKLAAAQPTGNLLLSPLSIAVALLMCEAGAAGTTRQQFVSVLKIADTDTVHHAFNAMLTQLAKRSDAKVDLSITDAVFAQQGTSFVQGYLDLLAAEYGAGCELVDYRADTEGARQAINAWVNDQTKGRIAELLAKGLLTPDSRMTLVNAIHLKAPWLVPFDTTSTAPATFTTASGTAAQVKMMELTSDLQYFAGDGFQSVELPYDSDNLSLIVLLPEDGTLARYEQEFTLGDVKYYFTPTKVHLQLPKFAFDAKFDLASTLQGIGLTDAFSATSADFSGISTAEKLHISAVVHQANITVDEHGTEAAAATAVAVIAGAAPGQPEPTPVDVICNRPFLFAIRDRSTDSIVFLGRVGDPTAA